MRELDLLRLGNQRKLQKVLASVLEEDALAVIEAEIQRNVTDLYGLGLQHYHFAVLQPPRHWRQKVSRLYYAAYNVSRSVRLYVYGEYSIDSSDHKRVGHLPDDLPDQARFSNQLQVLRADRNTADYDHSSKAGDLVIAPASAAVVVRDFLAEVKNYLQGKGLTVRGRP